MQALQGRLARYVRPKHGLKIRYKYQYYSQVIPTCILADEEKMTPLPFFRVLPLAGIQVPDYKGATTKEAPFVYRLGHQIFILGRGVRLP